MSRTLKTVFATLGFLLSAGGAAQEPHPDVEVRNLADKVWIHTTYRTLEDGQVFPSHGLIVREGEALTLVDTAWGEQETELLLDAIAVQIGLPVTRAVVTHFHSDRARGTGILQGQGVEVWAHPLTRQIMTEREWTVPGHEFVALDMPGDAVEFGSLEVFYPGPAHTSDNIMVWLPGQDILFAGCAVRGANDLELGNVRDGDIGHWAKAMDLAEARYGEAGMVVSSHAEPAGPELFGHTAFLARTAGQAQKNNSGSE